LKPGFQILVNVLDYNLAEDTAARLPRFGTLLDKFVAEFNRANLLIIAALAYVNRE